MIQMERIIPGFKKVMEGKIIVIGVSVILLLPLLSFGSVDSGLGAENNKICINELMTSNRSGIVDQEGDFPDWIELFNYGSIPVNLDGYGLSDNKHDPYKWTFPDMTINPGQYLLIFASGKVNTETESSNIHTNFKLDSQGETLYLSSKDKIIDQAEIPPLDADISFGRQQDEREKWMRFQTPTPGSSNVIELSEGSGQGKPGGDSPVFINEFLVSNRSTIMDEDSEYSDWIEIANTGSVTINLDGYGLSDDKGLPFKWRFPGISLKPGEYLIIFASGKDRRDPAKTFLHTNFKLDNEGETLAIRSREGIIVDSVTYDKILPNVSWGRNEGSKDIWLYYTLPTPGDSNSTQGFESLSDMLSEEFGTLKLSEALAVNGNSIMDEDKEHTSWIEIFNPGDLPVNVCNYGLSDDEYNPLKWKFPDISINPKEHLLVFASGKDRWDLNKKIIHTNFKLDSAGESIFLSDISGKIIDDLCIGRAVPDVSWGKDSRGPARPVLYTKPTPGIQNINDFYRGYAGDIKFSYRGGFYDSSVNLALKADSSSAVIRYTLDGSEPDIDSLIYSSPILIDKTTVVRARAFKEGYLPGPVATSTFFLNIKHTVTTISLSTTPSNLWDERSGIYSTGFGANPEFPHVGANYWKDIEKPVHFELYEPDGKQGLSLDAGIKIFGAYSRAMPQKSFSIICRDIYGYNRMNYPFFPDKPIVSFKSILLRTSGQDAIYTKIRDAMISNLVKDTHTDRESYRPAVVYLNGEYWGVYNIREKISPYYLASNHGVDPDSVDILVANGKADVGSNEDYKALVAFVSSHDMRSDENYEYVKKKMDIENFIDYQITEIYCANTDTGNIKFWRERSPEGKWRWILYDTDWAFFDVNHNTLWYVTNPQGTGIGKMFSTALMYNLLKNESFKKQFIERFAHHLNNTFNTERVISIIDQMANTIEPEMPLNQKKWGGTMEGWKKQVERLRNFAKMRPAILKGYIQKQFNLNDEQMILFTTGQQSL